MVYKGKRILGMIPARGGSKGLQGKNIRTFLGKPLIAWTIEQVNSSKYIRANNIVAKIEGKAIGSVCVRK